EVPVALLEPVHADRPDEFPAEPFAQELERLPEVVVVVVGKEPHDRNSRHCWPTVATSNRSIARSRCSAPRRAAYSWLRRYASRGVGGGRQPGVAMCLAS